MRRWARLASVFIQHVGALTPGDRLFVCCPASVRFPHPVPLTSGSLAWRSLRSDVNPRAFGREGVGGTLPGRLPPVGRSTAFQVFLRWLLLDIPFSGSLAAMAINAFLGKSSFSAMLLLLIFTCPKVIMLIFKNFLACNSTFSSDCWHCFLHCLSG